MNIYDFDDYKEFCASRIAGMPKKGRGEAGRIAEALRIHSTRLSHVLKGEAHFTLEQTSLLCRHWALSQLESEYFLVLVQLARSGSRELTILLKEQAAGLRERSTKLVHRVAKDRVLSEAEKAQFYSSWIYSAVRLSTSIAERNTLDALASTFDRPREQMREILDFLVAAGLCTEESGRYAMRAKRTHLDGKSPLASRSHAEWRLKAIARLEKLSDRELAYTCPVSLNQRDQKKLRELLVVTIESFLKTVTESEPADLLACLNIDFFEV